MRAGKLRHLITVQRAENEPDELGTPQATWSDIMQLRAEVVQQSTEEFIRAQGAGDNRIVIFRTRYLPGITNADRIMHRGEAHNIREIAILGHDQWLEIRTVTAEVVT